MYFNISNPMFPFCYHAVWHIRVYILCSLWVFNKLLLLFYINFHPVPWTNISIFLILSYTSIYFICIIVKFLFLSLFSGTSEAVFHSFLWFRGDTPNYTQGLFLAQTQSSLMVVPGMKLSHACKISIYPLY